MSIFAAGTNQGLAAQTSPKGRVGPVNIAFGGPLSAPAALQPPELTGEPQPAGREPLSINVLRGLLTRDWVFIMNRGPYSTTIKGFPCWSLGWSIDRRPKRTASLRLAAHLAPHLIYIECLVSQRPTHPADEHRPWRRKKAASAATSLAVWAPVNTAENM